MAGSTETLSWRTAPCAAASRVASAMASNSGVSCAPKRRPASVSVTPRPVRRNSSVPSHSSRSRMWRLMAAWVTKSSDAASVKLSARAAASKAFKALREGRRRAIAREPVTFSYTQRRLLPFVVQERKSYIPTIERRSPDLYFQPEGRARILPARRARCSPPDSAPATSRTIRFPIISPPAPTCWKPARMRSAAR